MASQPLQQRGRQSHQTTNNADEPQELLQRPTSNARSTTSIDSETLLFNNTKSTTNSDSTTDPLHEQASQIPQRRRPIPGEDDTEPRKCWICFSDETEDTPQTSRWRSPCPCALTAHEGCLLDWIADMENPGTTRATAAPVEIKCPQCKAPIYLARPRSIIVEAFSAVESLAGKMLLPFVVGGLSYSLFLAASHHGAHSIRMVFGTHDADLILAPSHRWTWFEQNLVKYVPTIATPILRGWRGLRVEAGLPLVPLTLILSRTSLGDATLPVLPIIFFATHPVASQTLSVGYWPPSAALTFVILPYIRSAYDEYMTRVWEQRELRWLQEIKPRQATEDGDAAAGGDDEVDVDDLEGLEDILENLQDMQRMMDDRLANVEVEVEINVQDEDGPEDHGLDADGGGNLPPQAAHPLHAPPLDDHPLENGIPDEVLLRAANQAAGDAQARPQLEAPAQPNAVPAPHPQPGQQPQAGPVVRLPRENILSLATRAGSNVIGALLFPSVAAVSGELLRMLLPLSWTTSKHGFLARELPPTGLLQTRWGRSVVGGCLFVVLKDAVRIYCRWKMAHDFRNRRVRQWDKVKRKLVD